MVYVDNTRHPYRNMLMCHMIADTLDELHAMAAKIGIRKVWFQELSSFPHYDICQAKRAIALKEGAVSINRRELVGHMVRLRPTLINKDRITAP